MAKGKGEIKGWITKNGVHIPIYGHYSIRGGEEPRTKGARWKKRFSAEGVKKALNRNHDSDSNETWYEGKINGQDVRVTQETVGSNKFWNAEIGKPGNRHTIKNADGEPMSFSSLDDAYEEVAHEMNSNTRGSDASKGKQVEGKGTAKDVKGKKVESKQNYITDKDGNKITVGEDARDANLKRLRERNANNPDVQARKAERAEKENPEWLQAKEKFDAAYEKQKGNIEANREETKQQARQKANEANSLVNEGMNKDEARKAVSEQESRKAEGKKLNSFQEQVNDRFKTKREWDEIAKNAGYKDSSDPEFQRNADDIVAKNKQAAKDEKEAKTIAAIAGLYQAEKQEQASSKATPESYAQSKGKSIRDIAQEVNNNDAARATANQLMKDGRTYEEAAALAHSDMERGTLKGQESSNTAYDYNGQTITHHPNGIKPAFHGNEEYNYEVHPAKGEKGANQYFKTEQEAQDYINGRNTKSQASSTPNPYAEGSTYSVKLRGEKKVNGTYIGSEQGNDMIGTWHKFRGEDGKLYYVSSNDIEKGTSKVTTPRAQKTQTSSNAVTDNRMATYQKEAQRRYGTDWNSLNNTRKGMIAQDVEEVNVKARGGIPTTVSGLRSAYAEATGSEKAKISAELRRKGYTLVGGKWVKGSKS